MGATSLVVESFVVDCKGGTTHQYYVMSWPLPDTELGDMDMEQRSTDGDNVEDGL